MPKIAPFGLWVGMKTSEIEAPLEEIAPFKYKTTTLPKPHSAFEFYILQITPKSGLSWVKALGKNVPTNGYGFELQSVFSEMEGKLSRSYGRNTRTDALLPGSIWNEPRDWMQALLKRERILVSAWDEKSGATLPEGLTSIYLGVSAVDTESGFISLEYTLENNGESEAEIAAAEDDAL